MSAINRLTRLSRILSCHGYKSISTMNERSRNLAYPTHRQLSTEVDGLELPPLTVQHDTQNKEFYILLDSGEVSEDNRAFLQYSYISQKFVDLEHTVVPYKYRGHGIAKVLAKSAFDFCVEGGLKMRLTCTYLQKYYNENKTPEYTRLVKD